MQQNDISYTTKKQAYFECLKASKWACLNYSVIPFAIFTSRA